MRVRDRSRPYPTEDHEASVHVPSRVTRAGWKYITVLHQDDVYGTGYISVIQANAYFFGLQIYYSASYEAGNTVSIRRAVSHVAGVDGVGNVTNRPELVDPSL